MDKEHALLLTRHIKPDQAFYVQSDDRLACVVHASVASLVVRFSGYFLSANGEVRQYAIDVSPTSDRAATSQTQIFGEGFLLSCITSLVSGNANRGQCYVRARIQRNTGAPVLPIVRLLAGYLTDDYSPSFPFGKIESPLEGPGMLRSITGTNPAAGVEILETVPTGAVWQLHAFVATLVTDGTIATRRPRFFIDDGTNTVYLAAWPGSVALSTTYQLVIAETGLSSGNVVAEELQTLWLNVRIPAGYRLQTIVQALQAGDNWGAPQLYVEEWLEA